MKRHPKFGLLSAVLLLALALNGAFPHPAMADEPPPPPPDTSEPAPAEPPPSEPAPAESTTEHRRTHRRGSTRRFDRRNRRDPDRRGAASGHQPRCAGRQRHADVADQHRGRARSRHWRSHVVPGRQFAGRLRLHRLVLHFQRGWRICWMSCKTIPCCTRVPGRSTLAVQLHHGA